MRSGERLAVIDCGTNTFHLLIGEFDGHRSRFLYRSKRVVKIGSRPDPFSPIPEQALDRAFSALSSFRKTLETSGVTRTIATGTAALRDSANGLDFLKKVKRELGFEIRLITGEREAELIWSGVKEAVKMDDSCSLVMDIGGGSTEFILGNRDEIVWKKSYRLGAARLLAWWNPHDPPDKTDIQRLDFFLSEELHGLLQTCQIFKPKRLIGASGSFETIAALMFRGMDLNIPRKKEIEIPIKAFHSIHHRLITSTQNQRIDMPGMLRMRAEMMIPASLLISFVTQKTGITAIYMSRYALKEGLFFESVRSLA